MHRRAFLSLCALAPLVAAPALAVPLPRPRPARAAAELPLLMLDAGHGGRDPGALGKGGTREKDVVLDITLQLAAALEGQVRVKLTREDDRFLSLPERVQEARRAQANLFISVHADSAPDNPQARGFSAYTLSETASDALASQLAEGENIVDHRYGAALDSNETVADILYDLAAQQTITASRFAKQELVQGVGQDLRLLERPKRFANFAVLRAPDVPSLLLETGFLSNTQDEEILRNQKQRRKIAQVLAREITAVLNNPLFS